MPAESLLTETHQAYMYEHQKSENAEAFIISNGLDQYVKLNYSNIALATRESPP